MSESKILREANTRNSRSKRKSISIEVKIEYVKRMDNGESTSKLAKEIDVAPSTLREWKKECIALGRISANPSPRQKKIRVSATKAEIPSEPNELSTETDSNVPKTTVEIIPVKNKKIQKFSTIPHSGLDEAVFRWFETNREQGMFISCARLKNEATEINKQLEGDDTKLKREFLATEEWLSCWKGRYGIRYLPETLDKVTTDKLGEREFCLEVQRVLGQDDLKKCQVFNCNEISWSWKNLPVKISNVPVDSQITYPTDDHVTVMAFSNADSSLKVPLVIIKKPGNIQVLENKNNLPLYSMEKNEAWMFSSVLGNWFKRDFIPQVSKFLNERNLPLKAVIIVDNAKFLPTNIWSGDFKVEFVSKNSTCLNRPFFHDLENLKTHCKNTLILSLALHMDYDCGKGLVKHLKESITLVNLLNWIHTAWEKENKRERTQEVLSSLKSINAFKDFTEEDLIEWLRDPEDDPVTKQLSSQTAVEIIQTPDMTAYDIEMLNPANEIISPIDAVKYLDSVIEFFCHCRNLSESDLSALRLARETANSMSI